MCFHKVSRGLLTAHEGEGSPGTAESDFGALSLAPLETRSDFFLLTYKAVFITMQHITKKNNVKVLDVTFLQSKLPNDLTWKRRKGYQGCYIAFFSIRTCMALSTQHQFTC